MSYVLEVLMATVFCFAIITLITGLIMLIAPAKVHAFAERLDLNISTDKYFDVLDRTKYIDRFIYRYHRIFGLFIILGASYTLYMLAPAQGTYQALPEIINPVITAWLYDALIYALLLLSIIAIVIGSIILIRPSAMKTFEAVMNNWKDTSHLVKPLDKQRYVEQQKPLKRPRVYGLIVLTGSLYVLWQTAPYVLN